MDELSVKEKFERNRLLKEIRQRDNKNLLKRVRETLRGRRDSVFETKKILFLSGYYIEDIEDRTVMLMTRLTVAGLVGLTLFRRTTWPRTLFQIYLTVNIGSYFGTLFSFEQGLYRLALFGNDQRSQEIRLLLNFYNPHNKYKDILIKNSIEFQKRFN